MEWALAIVALALLAVAAISRRLSGTPVTPVMVFVAIGLLVGPQVLGAIDLESTSSTVRTLAEATLALVLFADASRINLRQLRPDVGVPLRLLGHRPAADHRPRSPGGGGHLRSAVNKGERDQPEEEPVGDPAGERARCDSPVPVRRAERHRDGDVRVAGVLRPRAPAGAS